MGSLLWISVMGMTGLCLPTVAQHAPSFRLVKVDDGIALYERWKNSPVGGEKVRELKAVFHARADPGAVAGLLKDQRQGTAWNAHAARYAVQKGDRPDSWVSYIRYDTPWPLRKQDCCLHYHVAEKGSGGETVIAFRSTSCAAFPESDDADRIRGVEGKWILERAASGDMQVIYLVSSARSSGVPRWVADPFIHQQLFQTMTSFRDMLERTYAAR